MVEFNSLILSCVYVNHLYIMICYMHIFMYIYIYIKTKKESNKSGEGLCFVFCVLSLLIFFCPFDAHRRIGSSPCSGSGSTWYCWCRGFRVVDSHTNGIYSLVN